MQMTACDGIAAPQFGQGASAGACSRYSSSSSQIDFTPGAAAPGSGGGAEGTGTSGYADWRTGGVDLFAAVAGFHRPAGSSGARSSIGARPKSAAVATAGAGCGTCTACPQAGHLAFRPAADASAANFF